MKLFFSVLVILLLFIVSEVAPFSCNGISGTNNATCGGNICYEENSCLCVDISEKTGLTEQSPILYAGNTLRSADGVVGLHLKQDGSLVQLNRDIEARTYISALGEADVGYKLVLTQTGTLKLYDGPNAQVDLVDVIGDNREFGEDGKCAFHSPPFKFVLQVDGNMVIYSSEGK